MGATERPKQYLELAGRTLLEWALAPLLANPMLERVVVVLASEDRHWRETTLAGESRIECAVGGAQRVDSVRAGLSRLAQEARSEDWVLVHDAARPCLTTEDLDRKSTRLNSSHVKISYAVFCWKKKNIVV